MLELYYIIISQEKSKDGKPSSFAETYTMRRESHLASLHEREEEMRQKFVLRVKEKEAELKEAERELHAKFDKLKVRKYFLNIGSDTHRKSERCDYGQLSFLSLFLFTNVSHQATVNDEKRVVEDQRRALDEEIADFQRRKVILIFNINIEY